MEKPTNPADDISEIRSMMERSSKHLSLSGLAGVMIGLVALTGVLYAQYIHTRVPLEEVRRYILADSFAVLLVAITVAIVFSSRMAKKKGLPLWNPTTKHLVIELAIPLAAGGVFCVALLAHDTYYLLPSAMLTFYGLALINASKFAVNEVRYLGVTQLALGLLAAFIPQEGLNLWALGFGIVHIVFGIRIYLKYEK